MARAGSCSACARPPTPTTSRWPPGASTSPTSSTTATRPTRAPSRKLDFSRTLAFKDFRLEMNPLVYEFSDIDVTQEAALRGPERRSFTLFDFSAKNDPVPTMLIQDHVNAVPEFLGQSTGFRKSQLKSGVLVLGEVEGTDEVKYLHGQFGTRHVHLPRRPRSRGLPAHGRRPADRPVAAQALARATG